MPIKIPANLPAHAVLSAEGVMVMDPSQADRQDIRPLRIALLNLMPLKIQTENQFARLIGATPLQIELTLLRMTSHQTKNTSSDHMEQFYKPFSAVRNEKFDGLIITGAPIEHLDFQDVTYWPEMVGGDGMDAKPCACHFGGLLGRHGDDQSPAWGEKT